MEIEKQERLLDCMADVLNQNGFRSEVMRKEGAPTLLRSEARRQGKVAMDAVIECCFIKLAMPDEELGLMQFFVTLFENAPKENLTQLRKACAYCNDYCALGAFGIYEQTGQLYLKYNTLVNGALALNRNVPLMMDNVSLLLASVARFIDGLAEIGFSGATLEAVKDQELFP